jgi:hypothetical protein
MSILDATSSDDMPTRSSSLRELTEVHILVHAGLRFEPLDVLGKLRAGTG